MRTYYPIQVLSDNMVRKIAAGEVVERPYSIVKELMENAVDAFATTVEVSVASGGVDMISVKDDGVGFTSKDLPLSIVKNATSKIQDDDDLFNISTNGFRGEALSSISSVSQFEIITKSKKEDQGYSLSSKGGSEPSIKPSAARDGTMVIVKDLFFNVPARRKFLKSKNTEYAHIEKAFKKIALAHPEIHFILKKDEKTMLNLPTTQTIKNRIEQLYPKEVTQSLVAFEGSNGPVTLYGFGSNMQNNLSRPSEIWIFINGRWIQDRALTKAIHEGYRTALMEHKYPYAFIYINMPATMFDVNVHPTKSEVRFQDPQVLFRLIQQTIASTLQPNLAQNRPVFHARTYSYSPSPSELQKVSNPSTQEPLYMPSSSVPEQAEQEVAPMQPIGFFSSLTYLSVLDGTYLICKNANELILIDQHAAHERVLFAQLKKQWNENQSLAQKTLIPVTLELNASQLDALHTVSQSLTEIGIEVEMFGEKEIIIRSVPTFLHESRLQEFIFEILEQVGRGEIPSHADDLIDHMLSTTACHSAVRAHDRLEVSEIQHLLTQMDQVDHASYCPHGRPSFVKMDLSDLEKIFKRKV